MPFISILIPCFNAERWIKGTINSALAQDYPHKEVIVVDDGSTDNSWELIQGYGPRIRAERTSNKGACSARNYLLQLSKGEWLQYLDADDYLLHGKVSSQVHGLENAPDADILYGPGIIEEHWTGEVNRYTLPIPEPRDPWILLARWRLPQTGAVLWKKKAIEDVGGWKTDQPCCQEHELYLHLLKAGKQFHYTTEPGAVYRKWSDDSVCERNKMETYCQRLKITDATEQHLAEINELSVARQDEINQARFECARIIWTVDRAWARSLIRQVRATRAPFVPQGRGVPALYRFIYSVFGFSMAETVAKLKRILVSFFSTASLKSKNI